MKCHVCGEKADGAILSSSQYRYLRGKRGKACVRLSLEVLGEDRERQVQLCRRCRETILEHTENMRQDLENALRGKKTATGKISMQPRVDHEGMTVKELRSLAKERGLNLKGANRKKQIIKKLRKEEDKK